jgi:hypothetical protein
MRVDDNVELLPEGSTRCVHCRTTLGDRERGPLADAICRVRPPTTLGPGVRALPALFTDRPIVVRHKICPGCLVALATEIVPADEVEYRSWTIDAESPRREGAGGNAREEAHWPRS